MAQYSGLAAIYDQLMAGVDYADWARYVDELAVIHGVPSDRTALDLACGTGNTTLALAKRGYAVSGLDLASEMLAVAEEKTIKEGLPVTFMQADMCCFTLSSNVALVVSFQDGLNYLLSKEAFQNAVSSVSGALLPGGLFIFDINRVEKLVGKKTDLSWVDCDDFTLVWETRQSESDVWEIEVTGFYPAENGFYKKFREIHKERVIPEEEVCMALERAGLILAGRYAAFTTEPPGAETRRVFYVARKEG